MASYIARRLLLTLPVVWVTTLVLFVLIRLTPGDPVRIEFGIEGTPEQIAIERHDLGLDKPIVVQYLDWVGKMFRGDFGRSLRARQPVLSEIRERLPATLEMQVLALAVAVIIAIPLGTIAAVKHKTPLATATTSFTLVSIAVPGFFVSTMLVYIFTFRVRIFETPHYIPFTQDPVANLRNIILPTIALSHIGIAVLTRYVRSNVLETIGQDYIRTARSKGLGEWKVVSRHALRNAIIPVITLLGFSIATLWTGTFITERIFNWPGIGRMALDAIQTKDFPVVQAITFIATITFALTNLFVDIAYAVADPRISYGRR